MANLNKYKFSDLYSMSSGISSKPEQAGHGSPFLSFTTVFNNYFLPKELTDLMDSNDSDKETYSIKCGDIFLTRTSETLDELGMSSVALKDYNDATYSGFLKRLRPVKNGITDEKYMGFYLRSNYFRKCMNNNATMTLRASLNEDIFSYLHLYLPDIETQKSFGEFLYLLDYKISVNKNIIHQIEKLINLLYEYWFRQFDFPDQNGKPYKISGGKMKYHDKFKGNVPFGWDVVSLNSMIDWISGAQPAKSTFIYEERLGYVRFIQNRDYSSDRYKTYIKESKNNKLCNEYDILMDKYGDAGSVRYGLSGAYNVALSKIQVNLQYSQEYVRNYLKSKPVYNYLNNSCKASTRASLNSENLDYLYIPVPPNELLQQYEHTNKEYLKMILNLMTENRKLVEIRDWLSPIIINGQVRIN